MSWFILITVIFITLKLFGVISWSWWWVFSPIWVALAIFAIAFIAEMIRLNKN